MKTHTKTLLAALSTAALIAGTAQAAVITFDAGFDSNEDLVGAYGTDITTTGINGREFIISDSLGATPNIALAWTSGNQFEWHSGVNWEEVEDVTVTGDGGDHTIQVNNSNTNAKEVVFTPDAGFAVVIGSIDYGVASDFGTTQDVVGSFKIIRNSDDFVEGTYTTGTLTGGLAQTVDFSFTGAIGEKYTLLLENNNANNWGAIDDLTFGQAVPEPGSLALLGLGGILIASRRRRD